MAHGAGYKGGRQLLTGAAPGVGKSNRNGASVGVNASFWNPGWAAVKPAMTGVGVFPLMDCVHDDSSNEIKTINALILLLRLFPRRISPLRLIRLIVKT